jgi:predicted ribosomally synthesized peptide with nif11-like leader
MLPPPQCDTYRAFIAFIRLIEFNARMQDKVSNCVNPEQVIKVASSIGFKFSREDLGRIASDLYADFFPWAGKGTEYRVKFFKDQSAILKKSRHIIKNNRTKLPKVSITDSQIHSPQ